MEIYLLNTETRKRYAIQYLETEVDTGGYSATYQPANIPFAPTKLFWVNSQSNSRSLTIFLDGKNVVEDINYLKSLCKPEKGKLAPSILEFKFASFPTVKIVLTSVSTSVDLIQIKAENKNVNLTRAKVTLQFMELE